ncbi:hypothetical protein BDP27DRAFT_1450854 [Rhodocollybia butyracea]|uniref:Transmembrane protein n=1 Tax=Rhodocollybia butyracea TaxID=206335 RepID=A0A9P5PLP0_9AGAR|nr:hypothetical protein BDP27DRAFT_1450854 [Rhodocollybia butyracea]
MAYPFPKLVFILLCTGYVYSQSSLTLEMNFDFIGIEPLQMVGVLDDGAATTYIQVETVSPTNSLFIVKTNTLIVSASGFQVIDTHDGLTGFCNPVATAVNCQINEGFTTQTQGGNTITRVFAVETTVTSLIPASTSPPIPIPLPSKKNARLVDSPNKSFIGFLVGVIVGGLLLILLTWWLVRRRRRRQSRRINLKNVRDAISPFDPPGSHDMPDRPDPLSMIRSLSRPTKVTKSKQSEMQERERARMDAHEALRVTQEALNRASSSHEEEVSLRQQISLLIQIVKRIEERGVANDIPPDYESQQ